MFVSRGPRPVKIRQIFSSGHCIGARSTVSGYAVRYDEYNPPTAVSMNIFGMEL